MLIVHSPLLGSYVPSLRTCVSYPDSYYLLPTSVCNSMHRALPDAAVVAAAMLGATATEPGRRAVVAALSANGSAFRRLLQLVQVNVFMTPFASQIVMASHISHCPLQALALHDVGDKSLPDATAVECAAASVQEV